MPPLPVIASTRHPLVQRIRALARARERVATERFVAEGIRVVEEAVAAAAPIVEVVLSPRLDRDDRGRRLRAALVGHGASVREATDRVLDALADAETHQGVLIVVRRPQHPRDAEPPDPAREPVILLAGGVQDAGNVGALVRVAEAFGAASFVAAASADPYGPKAVRGSAGSIFRLPIRVADEAPAALHRLAARGYRIVAAASRGGESLSDSSLRPPLVLAVGSEGSGLSEAALGAAATRVTIPLAPPVESLNVATAAAVLLFAAREARLRSRC